MSFEFDDIGRAEARTKETKARLFATLGQVQDRLKPAHLAQDAVESAAQGVASVARKGAEAVRARPLATAGVAATIGLVMARGWIGEIFAGRRKQETGKAPESSKPKAARAAKKGQGT